MTLRRRLVSQSAMIFTARICGAAFVFVFQALLARLWGPDALGEYLVAIAAANILATVMPLGFQTIGAYFAADYAARGAGHNLRRFLLHAYGHIILAGIPLAIAAGLLTVFMGETGAMLARVWPAIAVLAFGTAIIYVNGAILIGLKRPIAGFFADTIFRPLLVIAAFTVLTALSDKAGDILYLLWGLAIGYVLVALVHFAVTLRAALRVPADNPPEPRQLQRWWYFALPWMLISLAGDFFFDIDLLVLSTLLDHGQLAVFGVCTRIFVLAAFGVSAVYAVAMPGLMEEEARQDAEGLAGRIGDANLVATGLSLVLLAGIATLGPMALSLFGPEFMAGRWPLTILAGALVLRAVFGPSSMLLSARNHPYASLPALGVGLVILIGGNLVLVPLMGLPGAALAALVSMGTGAFMLWRKARRLTGVDVSIRPGLMRLLRRRTA